MSDLLEFVFQFVLEILCHCFEFWGGWRFYLPFLSSLALVAVILWVIPDTGGRIALSIPIVLTGTLIGIIWHVRAGRS